jgi:phosphatidylglycerophosphate synthase
MRTAQAGALTRMLARAQLIGARLGPADWITLARATLAVGAAALVGASFEQSLPVAPLVALSAIALALDAVDGLVARRTRTTEAGARLDGEVDAFLIAVLSVYVARLIGPWVLAIGAARYAFLVAGWALSWMRKPLPPRYWRKVVAATQGVVLTVAAADVLPRSVSATALAVALALLAESFGRDVWWLWRRRGAGHNGAVATVLAFLLVWASLVAPDEPGVGPGDFIRIPLEGLILIVALMFAPTLARRIVAAVVGPLLALVVVLKILDIGFLTTFDRPFDPTADSGYAGIGIETLRASVGAFEADMLLAGLVLVGLALFVLTTLALRRLARVTRANRRPSLAAAAALGAVWVVCWIAGAPVASTIAARVIVAKADAVQAGIHDRSVFAAQIDNDRFGKTPGAKLLTALRGKDVVLAFVESYGEVAVQGSSFSPRIEAALARGTDELRSAGFSARSAFLTAPTFGGLSWLAHSTMQSGVWVNNQRRYNQLVGTDRLTLSDAFGRAGWRSVAAVPANDRTWPEGSFFYDYDKVYDRRNVGYRGPDFAYAPMPDQYILSALQRRELGKGDRRPVFAEVDLVSSHEPWTHIPRLVAWDDVGDGQVFNRERVATGARLDNPERVRAAYGQSIRYTLTALVSFVRHYGDDRLVLVVLGDHQPWRIVSGQGASHNVPISVIARDPAVLQRISGWRWKDGLRPGPDAPVWPMSSFRDRFLTAFGSRPETGNP